MKSYYNQNLELKIDEDNITALTNKRDAVWKRLENASFLTVNEKRREIGLEAIEGGNVV